MWRAAVAPAGCLAIVAAVIELCGREIARRSILLDVTGWHADSWLLVAITSGTAAAILLTRPTRSWIGLRGAPLLFAALFTAGIAWQLELGARLQSDGFYYFAYLRSLAFDRDVDFTNDYRLLGLGDKAHLFESTPTGHAQSAWTIGPAILWAPFFAAGHLVARSLSEHDPNVSVNGISYPYRQAVCIAGLFYGLLGCWFCWRLTARFFSPTLAAAAVSLVATGSFLLWYLVKEPSMTHAPSMALVAGFTWAWAATRERRTKAQWILLGLLAGFMTLVRWQNVLFAVLPASDSAVALRTSWSARNSAAARETIIAGVLFTAAATIAFLPQMLAWRAIYGSYLAVSPIGPQIRFADAHLVDILWSSRNGLLSTSPMLYCAAIGLVIFAITEPAVGVASLLVVALMTYFNACVQDWWGSAGYGGRRFDGTLPFFCLGLAAFGARAIATVRRYPAAIVATAGVLLVIWNLTFMSAGQRGVLRIGEATSFGDIAADQARTLHRWFGHPFTYPASLLFALRNRVSPARYDLLSANRFLGDPGRPYGRVDIGAGDAWALDEGWYQAEAAGPITFRWASSEAAVLIPLDRTAPLRVQVRLHAFAFPNAAPQKLNMAVNHRHLGPLPVGPEWETLETVVPVEAWRTGVNRLVLRFEWARSPADLGLGGDPRLLAAAVDYIRVQVADGEGR